MNLIFNRTFSISICFQCRLIVSQMSSTRSEAWHWQTPMFVISVLFSRLLPILERPLLYALLIVTTLTHWHYGARVVNQMCEHFNRVCFTVNKRVPDKDTEAREKIVEEKSIENSTLKQD